MCRACEWFLITTPGCYGRIVICFLHKNHHSGRVVENPERRSVGHRDGQWYH